MKSILLAAPAKINLFLDITSRRDDGYHEILSIMQSVSLCDEIFLQQIDGHGIVLECDNPSIPTGRDNIAYKAADLFMKNASLSCGLKISLRKSIPAAAGLAGGSTDAAAVLRGLNNMFGKPFSADGLCRMAESLGADVPFCVRGGCMKAEGIGNILTDLGLLPACHIVITCPDERVSTPSAYGALDKMYDNFKQRACNDIIYYRAEAALTSGEIEGVCKNTYNIFEDIQDGREDIKRIKQLMLEAGAETSMMSGSGPSVFGVFKSADAASLAVMLLEQRGYTAYSCSPTGKNNI